MNLFPEEPRKTKEELYYKEYDDKLISEWNKIVKIRIEVRNLISGMDGLKLQIAEEILKVEKSKDKEVRNKYYKNIIKKYEELNSF